jgi:phosphatidylglycerol:prolipoprotein diacylglycerol transferase
MYPILFHIFGYPVLSYTVFSFIAIISGSFLLVARFKKYKINVDYFDFLFWVVIAGAIGAKLLYIIIYPHQFSWSIFYSGGVVSWGGIIIGILVATFYLKKFRQNIIRAFDAGFLSLFFGLMIGRIGSFLNGDGYGKITNSFFGIVVPKIDSNPRFPAEIFEFLMILALIFIVLWLEKRKVFKKDGKMFIILLLSYLVIRIISDFFKDNFVRYSGLTINQIFCILLFLIILSVIIIKNFFQTGGNNVIFKRFCFSKKTRRKIKEKS